MTPTVELLIKDINDEKNKIENLSKNDFKQVFDTYKSLYNRCINLKEEDFDNAEIFNRFIKHIKSSNNSDFITLNWLEDGVDLASSENFIQLRNMFNHFSILLKFPW